jgi:tetratricopeptide (TPR) repeat protein
MSPEQAAGDPNTDHRADIYSFGCMAYEVLAGRPPFTGSSPAKLLGAHLGEKPQDIRMLRPDASESLAVLVMQCLEKDPDSRPQHAADLVRVLDVVTSSGSAASAPAILAGQVNIGKAVGLWAGGTALVALTAWAATVVIGLPDWVLPGSIGVMIAGLPIIGLTAWVQHVAKRAYAATPTYTPGGTVTTAHGTLHTIAIKASPHMSWRRTWMGGAIAVGGFLVLVVGYMVTRALGIGPAGSLLGAGKLAANDRIIISDFGSPADDSTLGVTITEALRADLEQSSVLRVMPRLAIIDALRLMQRPIDAHIDFDMARSIATREGVKAVLDGDVVSLGGRYVLSTRLISAQDGAQLAAFKEEAGSLNDLIPAIGRLGKQLREKVGESLKDVREAGALDRVTTSSLDALRKYTAANIDYERNSDYSRAIPLLVEAVTIDSTFAMAWRRLAQYYSNTGRFELARDAAVNAFANADRLSEVERQLTIATYYQLGPTVDEERALAAYEAALARDSLNFIALNNASILLARRRDIDKVLVYRLRAAAQPGTSPITFGNAVAGATAAGRHGLVDSLTLEYQRRFPTNPAAAYMPARSAATRGEFDRAAELAREALPRISGSRSAMNSHLGFTADLALLRGKVAESLKGRAELRTRQAQTPGAGPSAKLNVGLDSVLATAVILEDPARARALLDRAVRRAPIDSIPYLDRNYSFYMAVAALAGDTARARAWHAGAREQWGSFGHTIDEAAWKAVEDAQLAFAEGRYAEAAVGLNEADRHNLSATDILGTMRFLVHDRLQQADSAIAVGEAYITLALPNRLDQDALFLAGIRQRLGELYEAKGNVGKALEHYAAFVELWKDADPELQPRVRDVRGRIERLQSRRG